MIIEQRGAINFEEAGSEINSVQQEINSLIRTLVPEPRVGGMMRQVVQFRPILAANIDGEKTITITGSDYPWLWASSYITSKILYEIEDSETGRKHKIIGIQNNAGEEVLQKSSQAEIDEIKTLLKDLAKPGVQYLSRVDEINPNDEDRTVFLRERDLIVKIPSRIVQDDLSQKTA